MNERIWDLFKQSGIDIGEDQEGNIEKFAELIIRRCCDLTGDSRPIVLIKEHFGI
jgi:hypothetical protein